MLCGESSSLNWVMLLNAWPKLSLLGLVPSGSQREGVHIAVWPDSSLQDCSLKAVVDMVAEAAILRKTCVIVSLAVG